MLGALLLAAMFGLPGLTLLAAARVRGADGWPWPRGLAISLALGVTLAALVAVALGAAERYSLGAECAALAALGVLFIALGRFRLAWPLRRASPVESLGFVFVGVLSAIVFVGRPFEMLLGARDATVYTVSGIGLARQGSIVLHDVAAERLGAEVTHELYSGPPEPEQGWLMLPRYVKYPGFYYVDADRTRVLPQGLPLLPAVIAIFFGALGVSGAFVANNCLGVLAVLAVFAAGVSLVGEVAALAGATILALNLIEVWGARYPVGEILFQMLLFASFAAFLRGGRLGHGIAGFLLGVTLLVKVEAALVLAPVTVFGLATLARRRFIVARNFWAAFSPTVAGGVIYWIAFQPDYVRMALGTFTSFQRRLAKFYFVMPGSWSLIALVVAVIAISAALAARTRLRAGSSVVVSRSAAVAVALFVVYGFFVRPQFSGIVVGQQMTLVWLGWYLTPVVVLVGFAGLAHHLATQPRADRLFVLGIALTLAGVFLHFTFVNTIHPYLTRRFVPAIVPLVCLFFGHAVVWLATRGRGRARLAATTAAALLFAGSTVGVTMRARHLYGHREYLRLERQLAKLATDLHGADLVLLSDGTVRNLLGATLEFVYGLPTVVLWPPGYATHGELIQRWLGEGRSIEVVTSETELETIAGAAEFDRVDRRLMELRTLRQVENQFPDEIGRDTIRVLRYAAGAGSQPLQAYWRDNASRVIGAVCRPKVRLFGGDPFLLRRLRAACPAAAAGTGHDAVVVVGEDRAAEWQETLTVYGARFVRHDLTGVVLFDAIRPQESLGASPLPSDHWTLEASDGRGSEVLAVDGRLDTRWGSRAPQRPGMTFTVGFGEPTDVTWVKIRMGRLGNDRARELSFETSVDGTRWERRDVPKVIDGIRWTSDVPEETFDGNVDLWVNALGVRFLRLINRGESSHFDWSIAELEIYGRPRPKKF